jgi:hypothetical protein
MQQGWGAGQLMFQFGVAHLNKLNFKKMFISVLEKNKAAQLFCEKLGASCVGNHFIEIEGIRYQTLNYLCAKMF